MALSAMSAPAARVVRDGEERSIPVADVVPGDLVLVAEGDIVPADGDVLAAASLPADESSLTGESVLVEKSPDSDGSRGTVSAGTARCPRTPVRVRAPPAARRRGSPGRCAAPWPSATLPSARRSTPARSRCPRSAPPHRGSPRPVAGSPTSRGS
ncbi:hypothetical protein [Streptomyces sp. WAC04114]|uniref:P-type ATPase n=1 Tax=Streptomyces sp. WAC04114 TaxID=2867961 RepID=UPI0035ABCD52